MHKFSHYLGGILLVSGTTIGAGMLAMPVLTSFTGFFPSILIFFICYFVMLATAYFLLDVNFSLAGEVNFVSMADKTLGLFGKVVAWVFYLLLLYSLTAAYIAASAPVFQEGILKITGINLPLWSTYFCLPVIFGGFVYLGTFGVDLVNRFLMVGLGITYLLLVAFLPGEIHVDYLMHVDPKASFIAFPVVITSFGYHIIIPSLTTYMQHSRVQLRRTLLLGSLLPLVIYIIWQIVILGVVPLIGENSLFFAWKNGLSATQPLSKIVKSDLIGGAAHFFSFFAVITSFLGVSLSLSDFLTDGFKIRSGWKGRVIAILLTFTPPLIFLFVSARGFIIALQYAGACVAVLLIFLPSLMAWQLKSPKFYQTIKGRALLIFMIAFAFFIIGIDLAQRAGVFKPLIEKYHVSSKV